MGPQAVSVCVCVCVCVHCSVLHFHATGVACVTCAWTKWCVLFVTLTYLCIDVEMRKVIPVMKAVVIEKERVCLVQISLSQSLEREDV